MVKGTGAAGRVVAEDVEKFVPGAAPLPPPVAGAPVGAPAAAAPSAGAGFIDIPMTNIRQVILGNFAYLSRMLDNYLLSY